MSSYWMFWNPWNKDIPKVLPVNSSSRGKTVPLHERSPSRHSFVRASRSSMATWWLKDSVFFPAPAVGPTKSPEETWVPISSHSFWVANDIKNNMFFLFSCLHLYSMCYLQTFFFVYGRVRSENSKILLPWPKNLCQFIPRGPWETFWATIKWQVATKRAGVQVKRMFKNKRTTHP